ncbi:MAG: YdcF family protein [Nitrospiraceae bacterium]|nr:YdcF family protein [Nitrospiraceae bacterium]
MRVLPLDLTPALYGTYKIIKYLLYPLSWIAAGSLLTFLTACLPATPWQTRWVRRFGFATVLVTLLTTTPLPARMLIGTLEAWYPPYHPTPTARFDAVVVLAGGVYSAGSLRPAPEISEASRERTTCGAEAWLQGIAPRLVLSGGDASVFGTGTLESHEMKRWALRLGVPASAILLEDRSRTTYENALKTKELLGAGRILLVTSANHLPRAVALFEKQGFAVTPMPCGYEATDRPADAWQQLTVFDFLPNYTALGITTHAIDELVGIAVYWAAGKL